MPLNKRVSPIVVTCAAALCVLMLYGSALRNVWTIDPDASAYLGLGQSLAAGDGYTLDGTPHAKYPPGLPLLLATLIRVAGPQAYGLFHAALVILLAAAVLVSHRLVCRLGFPPWAGAVVALAVALSQTLGDLSLRYLRTEVPFLALSTATLLVMSDALGRRRSWGRTALAAVFLTASLSLRLAGITLAVVPLLHLLFPAEGGRTRTRAALLLTTAGLVLVGWMAWGSSIRAEHPEASDYGSELTAMEPRDLTKTVRTDMPTIDGPGWMRRVGGNLEVLSRASAVLLTNVDRAGARLPVGMATLGLVLLGLLSMARPSSRPRQDAAAYVAATLGLYLIWPFNQQERFYAPLLPLLLIAAGQGLVVARDLIANLARSATGRNVTLTLVAALALVLSIQTSDDPTVLGRWSKSYTAVVALAWMAVVVLATLLRRDELPAWHPGAAWLLPILFCVPWLQFRFVEWPAQVHSFAHHRAEHPADPPLDRIDVDPRLEQVALWIMDHTPADALVMTDVPKMLNALTGRRCVPFRYQVEPPEVLHGEADVIFYTRELADASAVMDARAGDYEVALELAPVFDGRTTVVPRLYRPLR